MKKSVVFVRQIVASIRMRRTIRIEHLISILLSVCSIPLADKIISPESTKTGEKNENL